METEKVEPDGEQAPATPSEPTLTELGARLATDIKAHVDESLASLKKSNSRNQWLLSILVPVLSAAAAGVVTYVNNQSVEKIRTEYAQTREFYGKQILQLEQGFARLTDLQNTAKTAILVTSPEHLRPFRSAIAALNDWQSQAEFYISAKTTTASQSAILLAYQILQFLEGSRARSTPAHEAEWIAAQTSWQNATQTAKALMLDEARNPSQYLGGSQ
jgi:hypothetical protein